MEQQTDHSLEDYISTRPDNSPDLDLYQKEMHEKTSNSARPLKRRTSPNNVAEISSPETDDTETGAGAKETLRRNPDSSSSSDTTRESSPERNPSWSMLPGANIMSISAAAASLMPLITSQRLEPLEFPPVPVEGRPSNFGIVLPGVYRSSYPKVEDYDFLLGLKLKTVVTLVKRDEIDHDFESFVATNDIRQVVFNTRGTKKESIPASTMSSILHLVLDQRNYPLLLHCNHGKHRTGCVVAAARRLSGWDLERVIDEYKAYATPKIRECDVNYITSLQSVALESDSIRASHLSRSRFTPIQIRSFWRAFLFTTFVALIWLVSGSQIAAKTERVLN